LQVFVPYQPGLGQSIVSVTEGLPVPVSLSLSSAQVPGNWTVFWGDGTYTTQLGTGTSAEFVHTYTGLGLFAILGAANLGNRTVLSTGDLVPIEIVPVSPSESSGEFPLLFTNLSNGSSGGVNYPWVHVAGTVTVSAQYSALPTDTGYLAQPPTIFGSAGADRQWGSATAVSATAAYSFDSPGMYVLEMVGPVLNPTGTIYQNYTWSVYVAPIGIPLECNACG
jgi:hypothetical protein